MTNLGAISDRADGAPRSEGTFLGSAEGTIGAVAHPRRSSAPTRQGRMRPSGPTARAPRPRSAIRAASRDPAGAAGHVDFDFGDAPGVRPGVVAPGFGGSSEPDPLKRAG